MTTANTGAYTRYLYGPNYVVALSTVNTVADEAFTHTVFDGMGRAIGMSSNNPGSGGGYKAQLVQYDLMGRMMKQSNPAEIDGSWNPYGDDAAGWLYTQQSYDWKGRPRITTNADGTQRSASYDGCGCAGGEVVTLTDEVGRQQKVYSDPVGRQWKTEVLNWDGTVYSTTEETLNALDQVMLVRQFQGNDGSGVFQDTVTGYDGYGRLQSRHAPAQDAGRNTVYTYYPDDTVYSVTDSRGAVATYSYNDNRRLMTSVSYTAPSGTPVPTAVSFGYDAAGNRMWMTDGVGRVDYGYDTLSRLTSETRQFAGLTGSYTLGYSYNLAGALTGVADSSSVSFWTGAQVSYDYDAAGGVTGVRGSGFDTVTQLASGIQRRAWGAVKAMAYGNGTQMSAQYDGRMRATHYELDNVRLSPNQAAVMLGSESQYEGDGHVSYARDLQDGNFDRAYSYDQAGRLQEAYSGREARGLPMLSPADNPLRQSYSYDAWGNMGRAGRTWSALVSDSPGYVNDRRSDSTYDADGRVTESGHTTSAYDASGREVYFFDDEFTSGTIEQDTIRQTYGGDGMAGKRVESRYTDDGTNTNTTVTTSYYLRSSVLGGQVVAEIDPSDLKRKGEVYLGGEKLAEQNADIAPGAVVWRQVDASRGSYVETDAGGVATRRELDPLGADMGTSDPYAQYHGSYGRMMGSDALYLERGNPFNLSGGCVLDGMPVSCSTLREEMEAGAVETETLIHDASGWRVSHGQIESLGVGLFRRFVEESGVDTTPDDSDVVKINTHPGHWEFFQGPQEPHIPHADPYSTSEYYIRTNVWTHS